MIDNSIGAWIDKIYFLESTAIPGRDWRLSLACEIVAEIRTGTQRVRDLEKVLRRAVEWTDGCSCPTEKCCGDCWGAEAEVVLDGVTTP